MEIETNVNPDDDFNTEEDVQWIEDEIDAEDREFEAMKAKLMDGYDVERTPIRNARGKLTEFRPLYRVYRYEKPNVGKPVKVYKLDYPDYKSMIKKHPELKQ